MALTVQNGSLVVQDGKLGTGAGCCCGGCGDPCSRCNQSCISLSISGFSGSSEGQECEECDAINGTYTLVRGTGAPPTISPSIQDTSGTGAVITADLVFRPEDGGWTIGSVGIDKKGTCYTGNATFAYTLTGAAVACNDPPIVTVEVERTEPLLDLSDINDHFSPSGSGASLHPVYVPVATKAGSETWAVDSVTVLSGGTDYDDYSPIAIKASGCTVTLQPASAIIRTARAIPVVSNVFVETKTGSGAVLAVQWEEVTLPENKWHPAGALAWRAIGATVISGGSGYEISDSVYYTLDSSHRYASGAPDPIAEAEGETDIELYVLGSENIGTGGAIVGAVGTDWPLDLANDTLFWYRANSSAVVSVEVLDGGEYYTPGGVKSLTLVDGGTFWSTEPCRYSVCAPSACKANGEEQCRQISLSVGNEDNKLTISIAGSTLAEATLPAAGSSCGSLSFSAEEITSQCAKVGTITLSGTTCTSGPSQDSCCDPCTAPCDAESPCPEGCVCVDGQCVPVAGACCLPERCVYGASVALLVSRLNGGPAPEIAGWVLYGQSEPTFGTVGCTYNFYTQDAPCDLFTEPWQAALDDFNAKILAAAESIGYTQEELESLQNQLGSLTATVEQASCQDGLSQSACESQGGTYHAGAACAEGPCCYPQAIPTQNEALANDACNNPQGCDGTVSNCTVYAPNTPMNPSLDEWIAVRTCCPNPNPLP